MSIQFTRYLYIKDEVKLSILISLLKKNQQALFWSYEFYYSGFKTELWDFMWSIYYNFYASLNIKFKKFLKEKHELWKQTEDEKIIANVINNFHIRPWNADVFLLKQSMLETEDNLEKLLDTENFEAISRYILKNCFTSVDANTVSEYFCKKEILKKSKAVVWKKKAQHISKDELLSDIIHFYSLCKGLKMGHNLYLSTNDDISQYKTIYSCYDTNFYPYKILPIATKFGIDSESMLGLFHLSRESCTSLKKNYHYNWLYYTLETPIWSNRIQEFDGTPNHEKNDIEFEDEDDEEDFYDHFNYEPDEQKLVTQHKNIGEISRINSWKSVFDTFQKGLYIPTDTFWEQNKKLKSI